jgi:hypothetical protein
VTTENRECTSECFDDEHSEDCNLRNKRRQTFLVSVFLVDRAWGGPEEGGWWYDCGELVRTVKTFPSRERAYAYNRRLNHRLRSRVLGPNEGRRELSSVLSDGEYQSRVHVGTVPAYFPETRPHYE